VSTGRSGRRPPRMSRRQRPYSLADQRVLVLGSLWFKPTPPTSSLHPGLYEFVPPAHARILDSQINVIRPPLLSSLQRCLPETILIGTRPDNSYSYKFLIVFSVPRTQVRQTMPQFVWKTQTRPGCTRDRLTRAKAVTKFLLVGVVEASV
jgi:hypothetical protein